MAIYDISNNYDISNINKKIDSIFKIFSLDDITKNKGIKEICRCCGKSEDNDNVQESEDPNKPKEINPLFKICSCGISIHYKCLKEEITKIIKKRITNPIFTIEINCPRCYDPYPLRLRKDRTIYDLIDYTLFQKSNYIILECVNEKNSNNNKKLVHFITLDKKEITIGSNNSNDVIDKDETVSSNHAVLKYNEEDGDLILKNKSTKSGTFVLIKGNIQMKKKKIKFKISHNNIDNYITANLEKIKEENK